MEESSEATDKLWSLASGPNLLVKEYSGCILSQAKQVFYLNDTKLGEPWNVIQRVQHKGVFDVPDASDGELLDPSENNDVFQQENITNVIPIDIDPIVQYCRDDVESNVISEVGSLDEIMEENRDNERDEEHNIPDVDMDPDMDPDM
ncbi:hypothetical protein ACSBR2_014744 [Camellia fascicularis]